MGFFDFVEKHHGIRLPAHGFRELTAFVVTDVAGRRADETRDGKLLHVLGHVDLDDGFAFAEHALRQGAGQKRLTHAGRAQEEKGTDGTARVFQVGARTAEGARHDLTGTLLSDDRKLQVFFEVEQFLGFFLLQAIQRDAGPIRDDVHHLILSHRNAFFVTLLTPLFEHLLALRAELLLLITEVGGFFKFLVTRSVFLFFDHAVDFDLDGIDVGRDVQRTDTCASSGLIHHVNRLVRQVPRGDVAMRKTDRGFDGRIRILALMVLLVLVTDAAKDQHRIFGRRIVDFDGLETAFEGRILFDVLAIFRKCRGAHALDFTPRQGWFQDIGSIHGPFGGAGSDDGMHLIDKEDDILGALDLVHDAFDALFKLTAILRTRDHQGEIEGDDFTIE